MTGIRRVGPTERMLTVLHRLRRYPTRVWAVDDLRRGIPGYDKTDAGDRNWQFDSEALRARGMIETGINSRHTPRRTGVRYALPVKPDDLHLSEDEHAALVAARLARGIAEEVPNPLAGETSRGGHLETLAAALRRLEEHGERMAVGDLAREMGQRPARLLAILRTAWCLDDAGRSVFEGTLHLDEPEDLGSSAEVMVCVVRRGDPRGPLRGRGLAVLGAGAYTLEETADRLALIEDVLAGNLPGDSAVLESAKLKLLRWQQMLREALECR
jgi:hypothetical protein